MTTLDATIDDAARAVDDLVDSIGLTAQDRAALASAARTVRLVARQVRSRREQDAARAVGVEYQVPRP